VSPFGLVTVRARLEDINDVLAELDAGRIMGRAIIEFD
jgi:D-arabinose 1-dehydrogenase-like Zn-dependent alcohol dehydrogenase